MRKLTVVLIVTAVFRLTSFASAQEPEMIHGVMRFTNIEGGCWYLETDAGKKFQLIGDSSVMSSIRIPDRMLSILVTPAKHQATTCMIGELMHVERIVDSVRYPVDMVVMNLQIVGRVHRNKEGQWYVKTSKGVKYLFEHPEKKYQHIGAHYNQFSRAAHGSGAGEFYGTIIGPAEDGGARKLEKKADPR